MKFVPAVAGLFCPALLGSFHSMFAQDKVDPYILQANIYRAERRFSEASELLGRAVGVNPEFPAAYIYSRRNIADWTLNRTEE